MKIELLGVNDHPVKDSWHGNDTIYYIRDVPVLAIVEIMLKLPPPDGKHEWAKYGAMDPARRVNYEFWFQRKDVGGFRWFLYQIRKEEY